MPRWTGPKTAASRRNWRRRPGWQEFAMRPVLGSICGELHVEPLPHPLSKPHCFGAGCATDDENTVSVGLLTLELYLGGTTSLKEKRSRVAPVVRRIRTKFNASVCESDAQDVLTRAELSVVVVSTNDSHVHSQLQAVLNWVLDARLDVEVLDSHVELIA
ncbi:MAG: DUF503 domain-containing protein [Caldilineaceae bacterium SB0662_bin_9]|uniref:DUF503 domain-containing protein n=1 Tax=Caldilineaceae bacterium SB0662_bin_9 TaxID=2605258 RepID=A0A6B1DWJ8_9CHLR|nr:DUF503 domain-containing protein [Caldilineaceae bacterium SB0666_bin_21]MYD92069.1 DUF503 domain-containing protein [Caldilineaceae bacterium SB0662_bin_9]